MSELPRAQWNAELEAIVPAMEGLKEALPSRNLSAQESRRAVEAFKATPNYVAARTRLEQLLEQMSERYPNVDAPTRDAMRGLLEEHRKVAWMLTDVAYRLVSSMRSNPTREGLRRGLIVLSMANSLLSGHEQFSLCRKLYELAHHARVDPTAEFREIASMSATTHPYGLESFQQVLTEVMQEFAADA